MKFIIILLLLPVLAFAQDDFFTSTKLLAEQGNPEGQLRLGAMYEKGKGVPQNYAEAVTWYRLAAEQGLAQAQFALGLSYGRGNGVPQSDTRAYLWFLIAAAQGHEVALKNRDLASERLTVGARNRMQERAARCFDSGFKDCD